MWRGGALAAGKANGGQPLPAAQARPGFEGHLEGGATASAKAPGHEGGFGVCLPTPPNSSPNRQGGWGLGRWVLGRWGLAAHDGSPNGLLSALQKPHKQGPRGIINAPGKQGHRQQKHTQQPAWPLALQ